jgi:hypothetical protein
MFKSPLKSDLRIGTAGFPAAAAFKLVHERFDLVQKHLYFAVVHARGMSRRRAAQARTM